jgi:ATP-dependent RNA helicase DDX23/PRP28
MPSSQSEPPLIDPSLLEGLSEDQKKEAQAAAAAAKRAEERSEQRALERAMEKKRLERLKEKETIRIATGKRVRPMGVINNGIDNGSAVKFVSKRQRRAQEEQKQEQTQESTNTGEGSKVSKQSNANRAGGSAAPKTSNTGVSWTERDRRAVRETYLGGSKKVNMTDKEYAERKRLQKKKNAKTTKSGKKTNFRFEWDDTDDTLRADDPLYNGPSVLVAAAGGRGAFGVSRSQTNQSSRSRLKKRQNNKSYENIETKPLEKMTSRDWRIFRENHNIVCKGGKAPPPLRHFRDGNLLHPSLLRALFENMGYRDPTPIQRQAIPIGLQRRDLIGIAETGSGKTAAFGIPLVQYLLQLPSNITSTERVAEQGPLAMVLAPTRELALQIDGEFQKLLHFSFSHQGEHKKNKILCCPIVGGQNMTAQAQKLREGTHVVVGTPGRINECLEMAYMVLNQCLYTILDEGDRMIDMGFAPQLESILDHMGGSLKSENEKEAYEQEKADLEKLKTNVGQPTFELPTHRVTAMFSATMPAEVEQMAKRYLRHPAVVSVGDKDSRNNARIVQKIMFLGSPSQKEGALRRLVLDPRFLREKVLVFVNEKKHAEGVCRAVERFGRRCVVLHGGKSQDEREKNLQLFKQGGTVLVATDVAGRGLDISNIAHVINYDLPSRSIDNYAHRIGRTGRAGKDGVATSLLTDDDEGIMAPLKAYLEATGSVVPDKLARHPAAQSGNSSERNLIY